MGWGGGSSTTILEIMYALLPQGVSLDVDRFPLSVYVLIVHEEKIVIHVSIQSGDEPTEQGTDSLLSFLSSRKQSWAQLQPLTY